MTTSWTSQELIEPGRDPPGPVGGEISQSDVPDQNRAPAPQDRTPSPSIASGMEEDTYGVSPFCMGPPSALGGLQGELKEL